MAAIEVIIDKEGKIQVEAQEVSGPHCQQLTASLQKALGQTVSDVKKPEFSGVVGQQNVVKQGN